ncbi:MAG: TolC family protein, partial [Gemmatimonadota bacterium]|nr:TolC family protein [Gemmatimonadota bacterium]
MSSRPRALSSSCTVLALLALARGGVDAQQGNTGPLTREAAVGMALSRGSQAALASVTARGVEAQLLSARAIPNPTLVASYSKSTPQYHAALEIPLDYLTLRPLRVSAALSAADAAHYRLAFERAAVRLDVDTLYTRASAQRARAALSKRNAIDADSLLTVARVRRDAGDASTLDVELARVNAGQAENAAASDSLAAIATLLDLQATLGLPATEITIGLADSLTVPSVDSLTRLASAPMPPLAGTPLSVAAAERDLRAAELALSLERRSL